MIQICFQSSVFSFVDAAVSFHQLNTFCTVVSSTMDLKSVVKKLQQFADPNLAESWDNVGLLVEPTPPHEVNKTTVV